MNLEMVGNLVRLRYKLLWAKTRTRNGKIALFVAGYLLLVLVLILMGAGGVGAGVAAVRSGKGQSVAELVLSGLFLQALISTVMLGFGLGAVFSETELRRYPLTARERWLARHCIGILDPFWFILLVLYLGLLFGMYLVGNVSLGLGLVGLVVLFLANYLAARAIALVMERAVKGKTGSLVLMSLVILLGFLPGTLAPVLQKNHALADTLLGILRFTPPFGAAATIAGDGAAAWSGLAVELCWTVGLLGVLAALEKRPPSRARAAATGSIAWGGRYDRIGGIFGPQLAPLVAFWLRFYVRNNRFRTLYLITLPVCAFLTYNLGKAEGHRLHGQNALFVAALGAFPLASFLGTSRIAVNQFGYAGGALRRMLLLPTDPAASLRAGSYAGVLLESTLLLLATVAWVVLAPVRGDIRMLFMLVASGSTGLFLFHGAALWVTLYGPRRGKYDASFGNDMSLMANILVVGGALTCIFVPQVLSGVVPASVNPDYWWASIPVAAAAWAFYRVSLRITASLFEGRRERLMAVVEGRA
jgi:hypothetical protein